MRWTRFMNKENGILLVPRLVCLCVLHLRGVPLGGPEGEGRIPGSSDGTRQRLNA